MAKASAAKTSGGGDALATSEASSIKMAEGVDMPADWLSDILGDDEIEVTGTEEMDQSDVRLPSWILNSKKEDKESGRQASDDTFWNTVTEKTKDRLRLVVLTNHKSRIWRDDKSGELEVHCRSWDNETGEMANGSTRSCKGCLDYEWRTNAEGKRGRNCTDVNNLISLDRETREVCVLKIKTTAIKGFRQFYQEHFYKKRAMRVTDPKTGKVSTRITDIPFFAAETLVDAEKKQGGGFTWYVPRLTFGGALDKSEILAAAELVKTMLDDYLDRAAKTHDDSDEPASAAGGAGGAPSSGDDFAEDDFVDATGEDVTGDSARF